MNNFSNCFYWAGGCFGGGGYHRPRSNVLAGHLYLLIYFNPFYFILFLENQSSQRAFQLKPFVRVTLTSANKIHQSFQANKAFFSFLWDMTDLSRWNKH